MPEYFDDCIYEPSARRKKYKVYKSCSSDSALDRLGRNRKHWTVLVAFTPLENVWEEEPSEEGDRALPAGHRPSFRGGSAPGKLARRARSFKDDFLGRISQMRGPQGVSPRGGPLPRVSKEAEAPYCGKGPERELEDLWKQTRVALKHFRDVVSKKKLEMLPGNGTIILDTVWMINISVKSCVSSDNSSSITSCTNRMYQSVARLIKLCDDVLIDDTSSELDKENVNEIVAQVEDSVKCLIELAQEKLNQQHITTYKTTPRSSYGGSNLDAPAQRNSLPDIPLTPREREILAQTSCVLPNRVRGSHSTESILREPSPPPKPPLPDSLRGSDPNNCVTPPPLPPKKKGSRFHQLTDGCYSNDGSPIASSLERVSMRSKSPEDSLSLFSEGTGSIDSVLNHSSREEDEIKVLMDYDNESFLDNHSSDIFGHNSWEEPSFSSGSNHNSEGHISVNEYQRLPNVDNDFNRLSNTDSGIVSTSFSKRSSQQSSISSQFSSTYKSKFSNANMSEMVKSESIIHNLNSTFENQLSVTRTSTNSSSLSVVSSNNRELSLFGDAPPAIPEKKSKKKTTERQPSPYDNVSGEDLQGELLVTCERHQSHSFSNTSISTSVDGIKPPPLPPKKKHIMAYMEMFGNCSHTNAQDFMRHSVHMVQAQQWPTTVGGLAATQSCSFSHSSHSSSYSRNLHTQSLNLPAGTAGEQRVPSPLHSPHTPVSNSPSPNHPSTPPALPPKQRPRKGSAKSPPPTPTGGVPSVLPPPSPLKALPDLLEHTAVKNVEEKPEVEVNKCDVDLTEELNVDKYLVMKKPDEDGPDIRGGPIDALIIQATKATKNGVFTYQEAFLTTYRTFITPYDLISKLIRRYNHFYYQPEKKPRSREAFALIVRVVSDLTCLDLEEPLQLMLMGFVQQLISCGELTLAKALRVKLLERHEARKSLQKIQNTGIMSTVSLNSTKFTLLDFKSEQIAEQMTLLDADLFMKIEIPEVLIWAQEQNEEKSQNLTRFTEHFNKMSFWARTKILTAETKEIREKYFMKFIKIMKHLRKINNFNSYLALLSALDSAPVRRLEWQKHVQEGLKEYCALIDSSSSFRALRMALAESQPPCIPYIGLVLQDLTFVHIGNSNLLPNGAINFSKRWQQFNIVENMKKFKKATYTFKKQEKIIQFFQNFDDAIGEDAMWKLSETIKPRGGKKIN